MHFILTSAILDIQDWSIEQITGMENLARAAFHGHHFVSVEKVAIALSLEKRTNEFSLATHSFIKKCISNHALSGELRKISTKSLFVAPLNHIQNLANKTQHISIEELSLVNLEPTTILAENKVDADAYLLAARHYKTKNKAHKIDIEGTPRGGGGNTIQVEFETIAKSRKQLCLAITDGDHLWPNRPPSRVSRTCDEIANDHPDLCGHLRIPVRELENLIPIEAIREINKGVGDNAMELAKKILEKAPELRICADWKDGTKLRKMHNLAENTPERELLEKALGANNSIPKKCIRLCEKSEDTPCTCYVVPNIAGGLGPNFVRWAEAQSPHKVLEYFKSEWEESWLSVGEAVFQWCCSPAKTRI